MAGSSKVPAVRLTYRDALDSAKRVRYDAKTKLIGNEFDKSDWNDDVKLLPSTSYFDILNYLLFSPSPYTMEDLRAYKGLEAYNQFVCGWVREKQVCVKHDVCVITSRVSLAFESALKKMGRWATAVYPVNNNVSILATTRLNSTTRLGLGLIVQDIHARM